MSASFAVKDVGGTTPVQASNTNVYAQQPQRMLQEVSSLLSNEQNNLRISQLITTSDASGLTAVGSSIPSKTKKMTDPKYQLYTDGVNLYISATTHKPQGFGTIESKALGIILDNNSQPISASRENIEKITKLLNDNYNSKLSKEYPNKSHQQLAEILSKFPSIRNLEQDFEGGIKEGNASLKTDWELA